MKSNEKNYFLVCNATKDEKKMIIEASKIENRTISSFLRTSAILHAKKILRRE